MRVFVAGATGAVGKPLVKRLLADGHEVIGTSRSAERARWLAEHGAQPVVCDLNDVASARAAVLEAEPEVVTDQTTGLPPRIGRTRGQMKRMFRGFHRLRTVGSPALLEAAIEAGARRYVFQSTSFTYDPAGAGLKTEADPGNYSAPAPWDQVLPAMFTLERRVVESEALDGVVVRNGFFYGPGTYLGRGGEMYRDVNRRLFPLVGEGSGVFSFLHVDDAAAATALALVEAEPEIYNISDDEPAPVSEWLPFYARLIGAKSPLQAPQWLLRRLSPLGTYWVTEMPGVSNRKAKERLGWQPRFRTWREGFPMSV